MDLGQDRFFTNQNIYAGDANDHWSIVVTEKELKMTLKLTGISMTEDLIENPPHYANLKIQPKDFIIQNNLNYAVGNVIKYVCRYESKGGVTDLKKARQYIDYLITDIESEG